MEAAVKKSARTLAGISPYSGQMGEAELIHLLSRTLFGISTDDVLAFRAKDLETVVDSLLNVPSRPPAPPVNNYNNGRITDPDIPLGETWVNGPSNPSFTGARRLSLKSWWIGQMLHQDRNILEKMTLFWHNHFPTEMVAIQEPIIAYRHVAMLRKNALGNFKSFVKDVTVDSGMLRYLNGERNSKFAPDENYSRELQELFTLGKGEDSRFTESDVREAARILTGWRINRTTFESYFDPRWHDTDNKTFSDFYGKKTISGKSGAQGAEETDELIDMIFEQKEVARFICRRLYMFFIYYEIDEAAEQNFIRPLADEFINNNFEIKPLLKTFFMSEHFFDQANRGCLIKNPLDFIIGMFRHFYIEVPDSTDVGNQYGTWQYIWGISALQQMDLGDPTSVSGWLPYHQLPMYHQLWINSDTLPKRNQISDVMALSGFRRGSFQVKMDCPNYATHFSQPEDPNALIDDLLQYLHTIEVDQAQKDYMKSILLSGQNGDFYWTDAWNDWRNDPDNSMKYNQVDLRLKLLIKYLMNLSEYQLA
jgi:hypothetical protein